MGRVKKKTTQKPTAVSVVAVESEKAIADALFLSIGEGAIVTDYGGKISRINQTALDMLGFKADEIMGRWYPEVVIAEDENGRRLPNIERPITEAFLSGETIFKKLYYRRKDGSRVAVALTVSPVILNGKPMGAIEIFRDITEEIRLDKAKDEFISLASHQLRTPATGVKQYLGMLLEGYAGALSSSQQEFITTAHQSNDRQLRIIDDILRVAAADSGNLVLSREKIDLVQLIKSVIHEQSSKFAEDKQTISFISKLPKLEALVDKDLFRMVIENLVDNAHKYTYSGKNIKVHLDESEGQVFIVVQDEGVGIDRFDFDKLFQKFSRLHNPLSVSSGGTGLGLYWVKQIVMLHGGDIEVDSTPGKGTVFSINIQANPDSLST